VIQSSPEEIIFKGVGTKGGGKNIRGKVSLLRRVDAMQH